MANRGRTVPVKVELLWDGAVRTTGVARLTLTPCAGGDPVTSSLTYRGGRWNTALETGALVASCHVGVASIDGLDAGAFRLELRGAEPARASEVGTKPVKAGMGALLDQPDRPLNDGNRTAVVDLEVDAPQAWERCVERQHATHVGQALRLLHRREDSGRVLRKSPDRRAGSCLGGLQEGKVRNLAAANGDNDGRL